MFASLLLLAAPQDPEKVDAAIRTGVAFLRTRKADLGPRDFHGHSMGYEELVLWTFLHAGVPDADPDLRALFERVLKAKEEKTYPVALKAMILERADRVRYQPWIARCAQFLADNIAENGQWHYGDPSIHVDDITTGKVSAPYLAAKPPEVKLRVRIKAKRKGPKFGDNSNSQYAALGIRACADAGIVFDAEMLRRARKGWRDLQERDGGWRYGAGMGGGMDRESYGSMTAGAVGSLAIYAHLLREKDRDIEEGLGWLAKNFSVEENPRKKRMNLHYYLYALERAGALCATDKIGTHDWYREGALVLLERQAGDGSWGEADRVADTCFAILFLRRATRPLDVPSVDDRKK